MEAELREPPPRDVTPYQNAKPDHSRKAIEPGQLGSECLA
jgi:hypothetical protein